jgi:two-component system OmpR family response regulator
LPVMDGIEVLEQWRSAKHSVPVLILTARDRWREKIAGLDAGANDYVTKPFQMEEVLARIRLWCGARQAIALPTRISFEPPP